MRKKIIFSSFFVLCLQFSCTKVVQVNVKNAAKQLVIQGNITNVQGSHAVKISETVNYAADNVYPPVSGALVVIEDVTNGMKETLKEFPAGNYYTSNIQGIETHTYKLSVTLNGKTYTATSTMPKQVPLDSVSFQTNTGFGTSITNPIPNFRDPVGEKNYYQFIQFINQKRTKKFFVFDDRLSDGKYIARQLFNDSAYIQPLDTVDIEMQCLDKNVYNYFNELVSITDPNSNQSSTPTNPTTNLSNGALGYFSTHTVQRKRGVFK